MLLWCDIRQQLFESEEGLLSLEESIFSPTQELSSASVGADMNPSPMNRKLPQPTVPPARPAWQRALPEQTAPAASHREGSITGTHDTTGSKAPVKFGTLPFTTNWTGEIDRWNDSVTPRDLTPPPNPAHKNTGPHTAWQPQLMQPAPPDPDVGYRNSSRLGDQRLPDNQTDGIRYSGVAHPRPPVHHNSGARAVWQPRPQQSVQTFPDMTLDHRLWPQKIDTRAYSSGTSGTAHPRAPELANYGPSPDLGYRDRGEQTVGWANNLGNLDPHGDATSSRPLTKYARQSEAVLIDAKTLARDGHHRLDPSSHPSCVGIPGSFSQSSANIGPRSRHATAHQQYGKFARNYNHYNATAHYTGHHNRGYDVETDYQRPSNTHTNKVKVDARQELPHYHHHYSRGLW